MPSGARPRSRSSRAKCRRRKSFQAASERPSCRRSSSSLRFARLVSETSTLTKRRPTMAAFQAAGGRGPLELSMAPPSTPAENLLHHLSGHQRARVPCILRRARVQHIGHPVGGRRLGRWVRRSDVGVRGRGRGPPRCRRWRLCTPREDVPLKSPADGFDPFGMRHSGRARPARRARQHRPSSARARCGACRRFRCGRARA